MHKGKKKKSMIYKETLTDVAEVTRDATFSQAGVLL